MNKDVYILDGYGLIYRSYYAFMSKPLTDGEGNNVSAIHGFFRTLFALRRHHDAQRIAVAMDPAGPTFRHEQYPEYKATRDSAPEDLHAQVPLIEELLSYMGIPVLCMDNFEADDVMGSAARYCKERDIPCYLVSADKDLMQLLTDGVGMLRPEKGGGFHLVDSSAVMQEKGVHPHQMIDYLSLIGDVSDNIPGVSGVGPKTAVSLLAKWGSLEAIYENLESAAKGSLLRKLSEGRSNAWLSHSLVTIRTNLNVGELFSQFEKPQYNADAAIAFLKERNMNSLAETVSGFFGKNEKELQAVPSGESSHVKCSAILTVEDLDLWKKKILASDCVALDTETDNIDPMKASLVGISVSVDAFEAAYLPIVCPDVDCLKQDLVLDWLREVFCNDSVKILGQNFKYDMKVLRRAGVPVGGAWFDTMIAAWILDVSLSVGMDALAQRYFGVSTIKFKDVVPKGCTFADVPLALALEYAAEDAAITFRLYEHLLPLLEEDVQRYRIFKEYEMPLQAILVDMELEGIALDIFELEAYSEELKYDIDKVEKETYALCGKKFNLSSPKQLQTILFQERGLTPGKKTKTGYSTDNSVLSNLTKEDPVPEKILKYRTLSKLKSTYVDVLPALVHPRDGRIHTVYSQIGAATGRLSSNNPNLQNIPIRDENGRRIRRAFKSRAAYQFLSADYSQIELVVLAHMSGDEALSRAFRESVDVHSQTAALLFGVDISDINPSQRRLAKMVNFGVMYGMSAFRLANSLDISQKEAKHFIDAYFTTYSGIRLFIDKTVETAQEEGGVRTMDGRFRPIRGINSRNRIEKSAAERAAVNSRIQGTAADIMKRAMISIHRILKEQHPDAKMLLQVHDELLFEIPEPELQSVVPLVKETMEASAHLSIPLRVQVECGSSWGDIH